MYTRRSQSEAILISNPNSKQVDIINLIKKRMEGYITATKFMMITYNISKSLLAKASAITPGKVSEQTTGSEATGWGMRDLRLFSFYLKLYQIEPESASFLFLLKSNLSLRSSQTSPTVTPLETEGMCAVSALINKVS